MIRIVQIVSTVILAVGIAAVVVVLFRVSTLMTALSKRMTIEKEKDNP
ncbi:MAG: hypothetical protein GWP14_02800 [Actinobacteria bacterium]|nr:hypothetical protein [Actinomycetota bacterium]